VLGPVFPLKSLVESLVCLAFPSSDGQAVLKLISAPPSKTESKHKLWTRCPWLHHFFFPGSVGEYLPPFDIPTMNNIEFDFGTRIGMLFLVEAFATSALAVTGLLLYIAVRFQCGGVCRYVHRHPPQYGAVAIQRNASRRWSTETHIHYYFLNLLICDLILSIGM